MFFVKAKPAPKNPSWAWLVTGALGGLLIFMSVTQAVTFVEFTDALTDYDILPATGLGVVLIIMQLLAVPALLPISLSPAMRTLSSHAVLLLPLFWTFLAVQAGMRDLDIQNCGCYGAYFTQELGPSVYAQDAVFVVWGIFSFLKVK